MSDDQTIERLTPSEFVSWLFRHDFKKQPLEFIRQETENYISYSVYLHKPEIKIDE